MTTRDLGETGVKLIGVYFAASALTGVLRLLAALLSPTMAEFPDKGELALVGGLPLIGPIVIAVIFVRLGDVIARKMFPDTSARLSALTRVDLLTVGVVLLGLSLVASALPDVIQFVGRLVWFGEASRQSQLMPALEQSWQTLSYALLELALGIALAAQAHVVASLIDRRHRARLKHEVVSDDR
ncbi:MAG TPA: hypothetical protein VJ691_06215 [Vicinamibacterales bacterium]|nr:hypothetical protein [Vicinamibacterales bacterium]